MHHLPYKFHFFLAAIIPAVMLFVSCGKHEPPGPVPIKQDTLATYIGTSFIHNTGSFYVYDSVTHTSGYQPVNDSAYRQDTLIVTQLGQDSIRLSGSLIFSHIYPTHYDFQTNSNADYTHELSVHSRFRFLFYNNYDSVSSHFWSYSGISSVQFAQTDIYFDCRKQ